MADNFLEEYQASKDQEAMAGLDKLIAKDRLMTKLTAGQDMADAAMMVGGPGKFIQGPKKAVDFVGRVSNKLNNKHKETLSLLPRRLDDPNNLPKFQQILKNVLEVGKNPRLTDPMAKYSQRVGEMDQKELIALLLPRIKTSINKIDDTIKNDILNNPNANAKLGTTLQNNKDQLSGLAKRLEEIYTPKNNYPWFKPKDMNTGGVASLMPLKYKDANA
tara:strand:+ start:71 stop:724 length:654 start_codon:yes stop_codon:yes gene_type:complete